MEDMKKQILALFEKTSKCYDAYCEISQNGDGSLSIEVSQEYGRLGMKGTLLDTLQAISKITGLPEVDEGESIIIGGCETCDYGSRYGYSFRAYKN